jgi:hypothetical protein
MIVLLHLPKYSPCGGKGTSFLIEDYFGVGVLIGRMRGKLASIHRVADKADSRKFALLNTEEDIASGTAPSCGSWHHAYRCKALTRSHLRESGIGGRR